MQSDYNSIDMNSANEIVIYKKFDQVWKALTHGKIKDSLEVKRLEDLCKKVGLVEYSSTGEVIYNIPKKQDTDNSNPFVVIEGLDGTGKTTLVECLSSKLNMEKMSTPRMKTHFEFVADRNFFDEQREPIKRAYYSLGVYIAGTDVIKSERPVIMDRFWHSAAAYTLVYQLKDGKSIQDSDLLWPEDLIKPDLVLFLTISENERLKRHANRKNFTNDLEEQMLANDKEFRENLVKLYNSIKGPMMIKVNVDGTYQEAEQKVTEAIFRALPDFEKQVVRQSCR